MLKSTCLLLYMYFLVPCEGYNYEQPWPVLVFEKGTQANIPCIVEGESDAYFWKKGTTYQTSKHVAANVHGEPDTFANTTHGKITVTGNGTLLINNISFEDDSTYFCRVVSEESEHYANVTVYTQVSLNSYSLSIEQCPSLPDCKLYLRPGTLHTFTCTASFVSPMVDLQWGSDQTNVTTISRILKDNSDGSVNISVGIAIDYERPSLLRCGANSPSMRGEVIIVELENEGEHESGRDFTLIVIVLILVFSAIGICLIVLLQKKPWKRKKLTQRSGNEYEAVSSKQPSLPQEELEYKDQQPSPKQEELECKDQQPSPKQKELEFKDQEIRNLKETLEVKDKEIRNLKETLETMDKELSGQREIVNIRTKKISQLEDDLKNKDEKIAKQEKVLQDNIKIIAQKNSEIENLKKSN